MYFVVRLSTRLLASGALWPDPPGMAIRAKVVTETGRAGGLQDLVLRRLAELGDDSGPMPALQAVHAADGLISYESIRLIARGEHGGRLTDRTAQGLAKALRVPVEEVYKAAGLPMPNGPWQMPSRYEGLTARERAIVEDVAMAIVESYQRGRRDAGEDS